MLNIFFLVPLLHAAPKDQGLPDYNEVRSHVEVVLNRMELLLQDKVIRHRKFENLAYRIYRFLDMFGNALDTSYVDSHGLCALLTLKFLIEAAAISRFDLNVSLPCFYSREPCWAFLRLQFVRRARVIAAHCLSRPTIIQIPILRHWPRVNMLPQRILHSLGCRVLNASLTKMFSTPYNSMDDQCAQKMATFNAAAWRIDSHPARPSLFQALLPYLQIRPLAPGGAADFELVNHALEYVADSEGLFLEFGVYRGASLNSIAQKLQALGSGRVYGFDSFAGLPELWANANQDGDLPAGHFNLTELPKIESNAELVVGYFNETLSTFLQDHVGEQGLDQVRFVHLDADLYTSTRDVLTTLGPYILPGCLIVIDDFVNFPGFNTSGLLALQEFLLKDDGPKQIEVLGAPWMVWENPLVTEERRGLAWDPLLRHDLERAVLLRIL